MRLVNADNIIKDRVKNDPVRIVVECEPTVDAKPVVYGKWLHGDMPTYGGWKCSKCKNNTVEYKPDYCPNCGATMTHKKK